MLKGYMGKERSGTPALDQDNSFSSLKFMPYESMSDVLVLFFTNSINHFLYPTSGLHFMTRFQE